MKLTKHNIVIGFKFNFIPNKKSQNYENWIHIFIYFLRWNTIWVPEGN